MSDLLVQEAAPGLCRYCLKNICNSNKAWDTHHENSASLQASALHGCLFCCTLIDDLRVSGLREVSWPLYRWNLRKLAPTRESKQLVLLTFRSIVSDSASDAIPQVASLPDRVFHFYKEQGKSTCNQVATFIFIRTHSFRRSWTTTSSSRVRWTD